MTVRELRDLLASIPEELQDLTIGIEDIEQGLRTDYDWHTEEHDHYKWVVLDALLA